jgi:FlaA1/EpsC-like NDP-sugar epimerase
LDVNTSIPKLTRRLSEGTLGERWFRLAVQVAVDSLIIVFSVWAAYWLRLDDVWASNFAPTIVRTIPVTLVTTLLVFRFGGVYRQIWSLAHAQSAVLILRCVVVAAMVSWLILIATRVDPAVPRSIFPIFSMLAIMLVGAFRFSYRYLHSRGSRVYHLDAERCLIYGAGVAGDFLARHIAAHPRFPYRPVGFIDDDSNKQRRLVHGLRVLGTSDNLAELCDRLEIKTILLAMHAVPGKVIRDIVDRCNACGVKPLIMPDLASSLGDEIFKPRSVDIRDLLRRAPKLINHEYLQAFFKGKTVFVSGAGGSIGSEICRQVLSLAPERVVMLDSSEYNLYRLEMDMDEEGLRKGAQCEFILGSTTDRGLIDRLFAMYRPHIVLHAAAYKHVPIIERNPLQGVVNNILGTKVLSEIAVKYNVERFLLISTDKAVRPTSVMGATKRACELLVQAMHSVYGARTGFCSVRFGNVLGSSGSVIPRFLEQIQAGGPVTVTHPDVTRYFMLIPEAVALVLQAVSLSKGGEIFVLDMGEPVKIYDMARQLILLAGKEPGKDIEIAVTGLRPGEKLYEELILETSECKQVFGDLYIAVPDPIEPQSLFESVDDIIKTAQAGQDDVSVQLLRHVTRWTDPAVGAGEEDDKSWATHKLH